MKKTLAFLLLLAIIIMPANAVEKENVKPVKNVILLIPDGTSLATISIARWLQWYQDPSKPKLNIDPYLCGTVRTHSSNRPIGDSSSYYIMLHDRTTEPYGLCHPLTRRTTVQQILTRPTRPVLQAAYHRIGGWKDVAGQSHGIGFHLRIPARYPGGLLRS